MVHPRSAAGPSMASASTSSINTAYSLALLAEYSHTLDTIPIDLSRSFADLRELDAVLSSSMIAITAKIRSLTHMIEENRATREERLWLLHEIAEEAARLKFGSDDKIRVAYQAADMLKDHSSHLRTLAEHLPDFDANVLNRRTAYPHVSAKSFMPLNMDTGRRRRGGAGQNGFMIGNGTSEPSPAKRKRVARDDEIDIGSIRSPHKKERIPEQSSNARSRVNNKVKRNERVPSPSESLVSVTSHLPSQSTHHANGTSNNTRGGSSSYHPNQSSGLANSGRMQSGTGTSVNKRSRGGNANNANRVSTPLSNEYSAPNSSSLPSNRAGSGIPASSNHNHLGGTYANGNSVIANGTSHQFEYRQHSVSNTPDWNTPPTQLDGPGMPVAKSTSTSSNVAGNGRNASANSNINNLSAANADGTTEGGDADGDNDDGRTYCYCDGVSFGEMIACDDENCEREWFHLSCIGLTICPEGAWYCNTCKSKRNAKRSGRGGKRRAGNSRAGGKA